MRHALLTVLIIIATSAGALRAAESIRLVSSPTVSPDGKQIAFSWRGDVWSASIDGGKVRQLTQNASRDGEPRFSPDGKQIAFISERTGSRQLFRMNVDGSNLTQLTFHSEGCMLQEWSRDGKTFLIQAQRDQFWRHGQRFFTIANKTRPKETLLFDAYGDFGRWSPDGKTLAYSREGTRWWRKGYRGSQASQIWLYDKAQKTHTKLLTDPTGCRYPNWSAGGQTLYYVTGREKDIFNLWSFDMKAKKSKQLTTFADDSVLSPAISNDGSTIVFRHLFDLYRFRPGKDKEPQVIKLTHDGDTAIASRMRRTLRVASQVAFSSDGLEIAFVAGGDVWVMDTVLREAKRVTNTPEEERSLTFTKDGSALLFISDANNQTDIWQATRHDAKKYWWQNNEFVLKQLTKDAAVEQGLHLSPTGGHVAFRKARGDLWIMKPDGSDAKLFLKSWNMPDFDWSPDGKWMVYAVSDNEFNRDVYVAPVDGSSKPFNLSRHPDNDFNPVWSPDGKMIAFAGRRLGDETDIYYVQLKKGDHETGSRDRKLRAALEKMKKARRRSPTTRKAPTTVAAAKLTIDFDGIHDRIRRVSIPDASEFGLTWSPDSKRLYFTATIAGKRGVYAISPPLSSSPKLVTTSALSSAMGLKAGNQVVGLVGGVPAALSSTGSVTQYSLSVTQEVDVRKRYQAAFDQCWRVMRDNWYDENLNNRNWDEIRRKYRDVAGEAVNNESFARVVSLLLGELNGSHLGVRTSRPPTKPGDVTVHLGIRFDDSFKGPGLKVRDVIRGTDAAKLKSKILPGEIVLSIDGKAVDPAMELTAILNGPTSRDIVLKVKNKAGTERTVTIRPTVYAFVRTSLYETWVRANRAAVEKASKGRLAYMHIAGMNMTSFYRFEKELYEVAAGRDGIVIDVRENGGGSTTDHLLTILTQPRHAITVPRGGGAGYPHDRKVYASWSKPIVVLCNQNSFSNAEIFSHAVKTLNRGKVVGVTTAGGVISTGSARIMDVGTLRRPFRGWFLLNDGEDMELNGAKPHHEIWPQPGDWPSGKDEQLSKAISVLSDSVKEWKARPQPKLRRASERRK